MSVEIISLFCEGHSLSKIAKLTGLSVEAIRKQAKKYEREGIIERVSKYPAAYQRKFQFQPPLMAVGEFQPTPTILPNKFGALCAQVGRLPKERYDAWGKAYDGDACHKIQFGKNKCQIWLKSGFIGTTPDELKANGIRQLRAYADLYSKTYGIQISILRIYDDIEWVVVSRKTSKSMADKAGIPQGGKVEVAGAIQKFGDFSHPHNFQINMKPNGNPKIPTEQAVIHHFIYSGEMGKTLEAVGNAIIALNQGMMELKNEVRKQ